MLRAILLSLVLATTASAQGITVPPINKVDRPFVVEHEAGAKVQAIFATQSSGGIVWQSLADEHFVRLETQTIVAAPAGDYLITIGDSEIIKVVDDGKPDPQPQPDPVPPTPDPEPEPEPEPEPQPVDGLVWVMVFEQTSDRSQYTKFAELMASGYWGQLDARQDFEAVSYDIDSVGAKKRKSYWRDQELPVAVFATPEGEILGKRTVRSIADLKTAIKEVTGRE